MFPFRSDFVYMVPPFLAYYGVTTRNRTMLLEGYNQIKLYRNYLRDPNQSMWMHVLLGPSGNDPGFWSTGVSSVVSECLTFKMTSGPVQEMVGRQLGYSECMQRFKIPNMHLL